MRFSLLGCLVMTATSAFSSTLTMNLNVDNAFDVYISTSDAVLGTLVGSGTNWPTTYSFNAVLTPAVTNYIHIVAVNSGGPGGFLGDFSISDNLFQFVNTTQSLVTNNVDWNFSTTGFGGPYVSPADEAPNGGGPWGNIAGVNAGARWIWDPANCGDCTVYFQTAITANAGSATPEPTTPLLLAGGIAVLWRMARRKKTANPVL